MGGRNEMRAEMRNETTKYYVHATTKAATWQKISIDGRDDATRIRAVIYSNKPRTHLFAEIMAETKNAVARSPSL